MVFTTPIGRVLFLQVPRCAGAAVSAAFLRSADGRKRRAACDWEPHQDSGDPEWPTAVHRLRHHYLDADGLPDQFDHSFSLVRHPLSWLESYFRYRVQYDWCSIEDNSPEFPGPWVLDSCQAVTFARFVDKYLQTKPGAYSALVDLILGPASAPLVDFIGRAETIATDRGALATRVRLNLDFDASTANASDPRIPCEWGPGQQAAVLAAEAAMVSRFYPGGP